jgi:hypothetical protein
MALIHGLVESLPPDQACVWEDEADIDLNPRIGLDRMLPGTQRHVPTPGKNVKRYLAGAMDARTDRVMWVKGERTSSRSACAASSSAAASRATRRLNSWSALSSRTVTLDTRLENGPKATPTRASTWWRIACLRPNPIARVSISIACKSSNPTISCVRYNIPQQA